jgi:hypothetical protein
MQTTSHTTNTIPVLEISHKRLKVLLIGLATLSVAIVATITLTSVTGGATRRAEVAPAPSWFTQYGPGSNSLSVPDTAVAPAPSWFTQYGPGSNSLSPAIHRG